MPLRAWVVMVVAAATAAALGILAGHEPWAGHAVLVVGRGHGLNTGDVPVLVSWAAVLGWARHAWHLTEPAPLRLRNDADRSTWG
ncbi:hypothetical protein [Georgenia sp. SUBG003]|uniref:hypothetical protein n=1 Tax=Georgenia sp. SUBG003 TaxID=1497974 RepID=UPI0004D9E40C|nr:hypothetical protein DA06_13545 [Georgenia sp. SUBG003]